MDQRTLVERAGRGDHDAFAQLVRERIARLDAAARLILHDPELARDAVQDGLVRAWRDLRSLRDPTRFDAWVHRLAVNACLDILRRRLALHYPGRHQFALSEAAGSVIATLELEGDPCSV